MDTEPRDEWVTTSTVLRRLSDFEDGDAWSAFAARFHEPVLAFARRRGLAPNDAEDAAQETLLAFAAAHREGRYDRTKGRLSHWLFGIAQRRVEAARRKNRDAREIQGTRDDTAFWNAVPGGDDVGRAWDEAWERALLEQALRRVKKEFQPSTFRAFEMVALEKRAVEDASTELGITRNAVYVARHRVMERMRQILAELEEIA
jgi:RNA polymerase sigma factor (sigma-70 family)